MQNVVAIDTEFERRHTYRPILSIVQLCKPNEEPKIYDVFKQPNEKLVELIEILSNDNIVKIIHACRQDVEAIYYRFGGLAIKNVFDTQLANHILTGENEISYGALVKRYCDANIVKEKILQKSNWLKRPLTEEQVYYAKQDVKYLIDVYNKMVSKLTIDPIKYVIFQNESKKLVNENKYSYSPNKYWLKIKKNISKNDKNYFLIKDLFILREKLAFKLNLPREKVIANNDLKNFAEKKDINSLMTNKRVDKNLFMKLITKYIANNFF